MERRPGPERMGRAFAELIERITAKHLPKVGGTDATIVVTIDLDTLTGKAAEGRCPRHRRDGSAPDRSAGWRAPPGSSPSSSTASPRSSTSAAPARFFTRAQVTALGIRDQGCVAEGCDWPPWLCHAHHWKRWTDGGGTDLDNGGLLCPRHHARAHDPTYETTRPPRRQGQLPPTALAFSRGRDRVPSPTAAGATADGVGDRSTEPHLPGARPWLELLGDKVEPRVLAAERAGASRVVVALAEPAGRRGALRAVGGRPGDVCFATPCSRPVSCLTRARPATCVGDSGCCCSPTSATRTASEAANSMSTGATSPYRRPVRSPDPAFADPRLAWLYDVLDGERGDLDAYVAVVEEVGATSVVDIGCGTGCLAVRLAEAGIDVVGVDPAAASLEMARAKPYADRVTWLHGDATVLDGRGSRPTWRS